MILVTGGTGYIGSHTVVLLIEAGYDVLVLDNLSNSSMAVLDRIGSITGKTPQFINGDVRNFDLLADLFSTYPISAVIHFAGLKAVGESVARPLHYYDVNVNGALCLFQCMQAANVKTLVFSSSATVYGNPVSVPIREDFLLAPTNPYGHSKRHIEDMLRDLCASDPEFNVGILRYFNPVGAHSSGLIGEDPLGVPDNLLPFISQVAVGRRDCLQVFGNDYPTHDGTGVRDYIHVVDLAEDHLAALDYLTCHGGLLTVNLGTGHGYSVMGVIREFEKASGKPIPFEVAARRPGDIAECYADPTHAGHTLGWQASRSLREMCKDHWNWQNQNPDGYK